MGTERCPRCGGVLGADAQWCGLCYADLRPPPPPPPPPPPVMSLPPVAPPTAAPQAVARPVTAEDDLGELPEEPKAWPCVECGARNPYEADVCAACGLPFGAALRIGSDPVVPGSRRSRAIAAVLVVLAVMALIAVLSAVTGSSPPPLPAVPSETIPQP